MSGNTKKGPGSAGARPLKGHSLPSGGDLFALGSKPGVRQGSPNIPGGPPSKKIHLEDDDAGDALFSNPIKLSSQVYHPRVSDINHDFSVSIIIIQNLLFYGKINVT
jgi:hypothetical protein